MGQCHENSGGNFVPHWEFKDLFTNLDKIFPDQIETIFTPSMWNCFLHFILTAYNRWAWSLTHPDSRKMDFSAAVSVAVISDKPTHGHITIKKRSAQVVVD